MSTRNHEVIRASAGTGKTHALALRFLTLLFDGVGPERILATTFTKKAAGEILERVFERLVNAARVPAELRTLTDQLGPAASGVTADRCEALVASLAKQIDRFQVRTLDSFFARVARLYAYELGLPPDWRVADEAELADQSEEAVGQLLVEDDTKEGRAGILELLRALQGSNPANSVTSSLLRTVGTGLEVWTESLPEAWDCIRIPEGLSDARLADLLNAFEQHPTPTKKDGSGNGHWVKAIAANVANARAGNWESVLGAGLVKAVAEDKDVFYKHALCDELRALLTPLIRHAQGKILATVVHRNLAARSLLERYSGHLHGIQRDSGVLGFSDVPRSIAPADGDAPLTERELDMWFRLDGRVDHLLLDEFQDTSSMQWRILGRLAEEILAEAPGERSFFCVGDGKQSIYGFRQAEPRLLEELCDPDFVIERELSDSYRSAQPVLDTVNRLFGALKESQAILEASGDDREAIFDSASTFAEGFRAHTSARPDLEGVTLLLQPEVEEPADDAEEPGPTAAELVLELAAQRIAAIATEAPSASVGVLFRTHAPVPGLLRRLDQLGVSASGVGGNPLTDAVCVVEVLALLHLADYPGDKAAAYHVVRSGLGAPLGLTDDSTSAERETAANEVRTQVQTIGFGGFLSGLRHSVAQRHPDAWQQGRFRQLIELAHAQDARGATRTGAFVRQVRRTRVESSSPAQVQVMTIHASKGLGFDAVVLPELDAAIFHQPPSFLISRPDPRGPICAISHCPKKEIRAFSPELLELWAGHVELTMRDSLCLLYVAATRAARRLEFIVAPVDPEAKSPRLSWAQLLRAGLIDEAGESPAVQIPGAEVLAECGNFAPGAWAKGRDQTPVVTDSTPPELPIGLGFPAAPATTISSASALAADRRSVPERLATSDGKARRRGILIHRLFQEVEWLEDFDLDSPELEPILLRLALDGSQRAEALAAFQSAAAQPEVQDALSRSGHPSPPEVWRERRFCLRPESGPSAGRLVQGAMDRVHVTRAAGEPVRATIYDYKSSGDQDAAHQLELYRHVLATQLNLNPDAIDARVLVVG